MHLHFILSTFCLYILQTCSASHHSGKQHRISKSIEKNPTPQYLDDLLSSKKYGEFSEIMKISNVDLVNATQRKSSAYEMFFYSGTLLGDIVLRPGQLLNPDQLTFDGIINLSINKWENGTVPYYLSKEYADNETQLIEDEIKKNNEYYAPQINFRHYQDGDTDFVMFFKGGCGCYTNLGHVGGPQAISMNSPCVFKGSMSHELQHTIGIPHASNRLDRDDYLILYPKNIPEVMKPQYARYAYDNPANIGKMDYYSRMYYPADTPGFGIPAFDFTEDGIDRDHVGVDQFQILTDEDIKRAKQFYS